MAKRATIVGSGPNGLAAAVALARAGYEVRGARGVRHDRRRRPHRRAHAPGIPARRLLGGAPCGAELPVLPRLRAARAHRVDRRPRSRTPSRSTAGARRDRVARPRPHRRRPRSRRSRLAGRRASARCAPRRPRRLHRHRSCSGAAASGHDGPFRAARPAAGLPARTPHLRDRGGGRPARRRRSRTRTPPCPRSARRRPALFLAGARAHGRTAGRIPRGGRAAIADALVADLRHTAATVETRHPVRSPRSPRSIGVIRMPVTCCCSTPHRVCVLTHPDLPARVCPGIRRYAYGAGAAKVDFALDGPVPWAHPDVGRVADRAPRRHPRRGRGERERRRPGRGERPPVRARGAAVGARRLAGARRASRCCGRTCTCPRTRTLDPTELVTRQVERFAPGFRDRILASHAMSAADRARRSTRPTSAATSSAARSRSPRRSAGRSSRERRGARRCAGCTSRRRRRRRDPASPACPGGTRRARPCATPPGVRVELEDLFED